jgi:glycosyltransferase involved in cell wall biosynthesis
LLERAQVHANYFQAILIDLKKATLFLVKNLLHPLTMISKVKDWKRDVAISRLTPHARVQQCVDTINSQSAYKRARIVDLPRADLVQAYLAADLFVFASHVEYSPLVLFEAAAAGTPFLSSNAGNAKEIITWLGGGFLMQDSANLEGFRIVKPQILANEITALINQQALLKKTGQTIQSNWKQYFTWDKIARRYEEVLKG